MTENTKGISLKEFLDMEKTKETIKQAQEILTGDAETAALIEKAESEEDLYEVFKKYVTIPAQYIKTLLHEVTEYFKADKVALSDETMDNVVGGWSFSNFWKTYKSVIISAAIVVCVVGAVFATGGAAVGVAVGGSAAIASTSGAGAAVGGLIGWCAGTTIGGCVVISNYLN